MWLKIKAHMRATKARTREELERALVAALELVTGADCVGWFKHCGYQVRLNRNQRLKPCWCRAWICTRRPKAFVRDTVPLCKAEY